MPKESKKQEVYQVKINLIEAKPPIWRRLLVPTTITLGDFHHIIQIAMGWENSHLHGFFANGVRYETIDEEDDFDFGFPREDENKIKLSQVLQKEGDGLMYVYDFGDSWEHKIVLEKIQMVEGDVKVPSCIKGRRACPPEDIGGIWGFAEYLEIIGNPSHPEYKEKMEWYGPFDPAGFDKADMEEINNILAGSF